LSAGLNISAAAVAKLWRSRVTRPRLIQSVTSRHQPTDRITAARLKTLWWSD